MMSMLIGFYSVHRKLRHRQTPVSPPVPTCFTQSIQFAKDFLMT